jgi:hypothetical protein
VRGTYLISEPGALQACKYHRQHTVVIAQNIGIPESQNAITLSMKGRVASVVMDILRVLPSIDFNDQFFVPTEEIDDVRQYSRLTNELEPAEPPIAERQPQFCFGVGRLSPEASLDTHLCSLRSTHGICPSPGSRP